MHPPATPKPYSAAEDPVHAAMMRQAHIEELKREAEWQERRRKRLRRHAVSGAILFFVANSLLQLPVALMPTVLLANAIGAVLFGLPLGWVISAFGGGMYRGAAIGSLLCAVIIYGFGLIAGEASLGGALLGGVIIGGFAGALTGMHAEMDR